MVCLHTLYSVSSYHLQSLHINQSLVSFTNYYPLINFKLESDGQFYQNLQQELKKAILYSINSQFSDTSDYLKLLLFLYL